MKENINQSPQMPEKNSRKKIYQRSAILLAACLLLCALIAAYLSNSQRIENHHFAMGNVKVILNDNTTIFNGTEFNMEPGHSIKKEFTVENAGSADAYYRIYLSAVSGELKDVLSIEIKNGEKTIFHDRLSEMTRQNPATDEEILKIGEVRTLIAIITMDANASSLYENKDVAFDIQLEAVQAKNNPNREF